MRAKPLQDLLAGGVVGFVAMLPGASGATVAVVLGIYERLIADLANIRGKLLHDLRFAVPVAIGLLIGIFVCAYGLDALMDEWEVPMMFLFAALVLTQIPDVRAMADDGAPMTRANWAALICGFLVMIAVLALGLSGVEGEDVSGNVVVWLIAGVIMAVSHLAPGISGSTILLALGLYAPMMSSITDLDMAILIPLAVGLVVGILAFARAFDRLVTRSRKSTYMAILGLTVGSVFAVAIEAAADVDGTTMILESIAAVVIGLVLGYVLTRCSRYYKKENSEEPLGGARSG